MCAQGKNILVERVERFKAFASLIIDESGFGRPVLHAGAMVISVNYVAKPRRRKVEH